MTRLKVGVVGCGRMGQKRAQALGAHDQLVGCTDVNADAAEAFSRRHGVADVSGLDELIDLGPDVVIIATTHDRLAPLTEQALNNGVHVLAEKPAGLGTRQIDRLRAVAAQRGRLVKVGFNHRFHPALQRVAEEVKSGAYGTLMHLRARYGHGGRPGYDSEWRAKPELSGGGQLVDQGMHLLDLTNWLAGPLPLQCALLRTHFWQTEVEDNAALLLGTEADRAGPWALLHVSWTEWKNIFSLEIYCRTAKLQVDGLAGSYGPQRLRIYRMRPELGPPDLEEIDYPLEDVSWSREWEHFASAITGRVPLTGDLDDALYAWQCVEEAYARGPYSTVRAQVPA